MDDAADVPPDYDTGTYAGSAPPAVAASMPRISDYWPDKTGAAPVPPPEAPTTIIAPPPEPPRRRLRLLAASLGAVLFLGVSVVVLTRLVAGGDDPAPVPTAAGDSGIIVGGSPNPPVSVAPPPAPTSAAATTAPPATAPASPAPPAGPAFEAGTFVLASGLTEINVTLGRPQNNGIARVSSPSGSGVVPDAKLNGTDLTLTAERKGDKGSGDVHVVLDERIVWTVRMEGGVRRGSFDMAKGSVRDFYFEGGANELDLTLPRQDRQIEIRMAGGVHEWRIGTEGEFRVKVRVRKGAGEITLNGDRDESIDGGRTVRARGRDDKSGGLTIEAVGGIGSLSVSPLENSA
ncbi:hypothetical protein KOI35_37020 [Actinoplanes bogorensis]|uniref:Adhesin domain-containing protein n=1 Tax=Paractinoplanes bogorensis TaxID=1610840 RepID=A0ABS5Z0B3_9ACTN|nr:hypothetical protein [Actinoplanes bogorensis]MBU2669130.1 hypothetical protein [Actinoplanes bogorensis]